MSVEVKDIIIGEGKPKVCVPVVEDNGNDIIDRLKEMDALDVDLIELRIDFYKDIENNDAVSLLFNRIHQLNLKKPVILTCRTLNEGGQVELDSKQYLNLYQCAIDSEAFDIYDVELSAGTNMIIELRTMIHGAGKYVLMSIHNFQRTPEQESLMQKFKIMDSFDADILKIAVMPEDMLDVFNLLSLTVKAKEKYPDKPIVTMSMSNLGLVSRLLGEQCGSAITFGCVGKTSAPGQIDYQELNQILDIIHHQIG